MKTIMILCVCYQAACKNLFKGPKCRSSGQPSSSHLLQKQQTPASKRYKSNRYPNEIFDKCSMEYSPPGTKVGIQTIPISKFNKTCTNKFVMQEQWPNCFWSVRSKKGALNLNIKCFIAEDVRGWFENNFCAPPPIRCVNKKKNEHQ